jgi:hypothetical protein
MADGEQASSAVRVAGTVVLGLVILIVLFLWRAGGAFESELLGPAKAPAVVKAEKKMKKQKAEVVKQPSPQVAVRIAMATTLSACLVPSPFFPCCFTIDDALPGLS